MPDISNNTDSIWGIKTYPHLFSTPDNISLDPGGLLELLQACSAWMAAERHSVLQFFVYHKTTLLGV